MKTFFLRSILCVAAVLGLATLASAQVVVSRYGSPVYVPAPAPITTYYAPSAPVTTYYSPPVVNYYAPSAPVTTYSAPVTTYYAPSVPVATTTLAPVVPAAPAVVYRPNPILFPRRRVVVAPYGAPYYVPTVTNRIIIP